MNRHYCPSGCTRCRASRSRPSAVRVRIAKRQKVAAKPVTEVLDALATAKAELYSINLNIATLLDIEHSDKRFGLIHCADNVGINPETARQIHGLVMTDYCRARTKVMVKIKRTMTLYLASL